MVVFHRERLEDCINSDLANNYGNLCQRVDCFCRKKLFFKNTSLNIKFDDADLDYVK